jgi:hypothetical protein
VATCSCLFALPKLKFFLPCIYANFSQYSLFFYLKNQARISLWNIGALLPNHMATHPRRPWSYNICLSFISTNTYVCWHRTEILKKTTGKHRRPIINWPMYHSNVALYYYINLNTLDQCSPTFSTWRNPRNKFYTLENPYLWKCWQARKVDSGKPLCHHWWGGSVKI